jgi:hypothetical protein
MAERTKPLTTTELLVLDRLRQIREGLEKPLQYRCANCEVTNPGGPTCLEMLDGK